MNPEQLNDLIKRLAAMKRFVCPSKVLTLPVKPKYDKNFGTGVIPRPVEAAASEPVPNALSREKGKEKP